MDKLRSFDDKSRPGFDRRERLREKSRNIIVCFSPQPTLYIYCWNLHSIRSSFEESLRDMQYDEAYIHGCKYIIYITKAIPIGDYQLTEIEKRTKQEDDVWKKLELVSEWMDSEERCKEKEKPKHLEEHTTDGENERSSSRAPEASKSKSSPKEKAKTEEEAKAAANADTRDGPYTSQVAAKARVKKKAEEEAVTTAKVEDIQENTQEPDAKPRAIGSFLFDSGCNWSRLEKVHIYCDKHSGLLGRVYFEFDKVLGSNETLCPSYDGKPSGEPKVFAIDADDSVARVDVWTGNRGVCGIQFHMASGWISELYGMATEDSMCSSFAGDHPDSKLVGLRGVYNNAIQKLGFSFVKRKALQGNQQAVVPPVVNGKNDISNDIAVLLERVEQPAALAKSDGGIEVDFISSKAEEAAEKEEEEEAPQSGGGLFGDDAEGDY